MIIKSNVFWDYFYSDSCSSSSPEKRGKWVYFFKDWKKAYDLVKGSVEEGHIESAKITSFDVFEVAGSGVVCLYLEIDDLKSHKKILSYMIENNMIPRTKSHRLYNISFKLDSQTRANEYGENFKPELKLNDLMDLEKEEWKT